MIIIINDFDASLLRDFIYNELIRRTKNTSSLPDGTNILDKIVTGEWWKALQTTLVEQLGMNFDYPVQNNTIITKDMRDELIDKAIKLYEEEVHNIP